MIIGIINEPSYIQSYLFVVPFLSSFAKKFLLVNYLNDKWRKLADQLFSPSVKKVLENQAVAFVTIAYSIIIGCRFCSLESSLLSGPLDLLEIALKQ